jgi:hypothetical protein
MAVLDIWFLCYWRTINVTIILYYNGHVRKVPTTVPPYDQNTNIVKVFDMTDTIRLTVSSTQSWYTCMHLTISPYVCHSYLASILHQTLICHSYLHYIIFLNL